ncbi:hypothetical protein PEP31012_02339 [Pandoraea eparura]|uniref:Uncharacterized protein n=1 Tax=Pandoraea eparura TaxID=2508291 RepID=A0A5E4UZ99_9BURK|nr:hypothetical protein PEP31012_02339 [Pandoraea eparura]
MASGWPRYGEDIARVWRGCSVGRSVEAARACRVKKQNPRTRARVLSYAEDGRKASYLPPPLAGLTAQLSLSETMRLNTGLPGAES